MIEIGNQCLIDTDCGENRNAQCIGNEKSAATKTCQCLPGFREPNCNPCNCAETGQRLTPPKLNCA